MVSRPKDLEALLWAYQLKREHNYLLERTTALEASSKSQDERLKTAEAVAARMKSADLKQIAVDLASIRQDDGDFERRLQKIEETEQNRARVEEPKLAALAEKVKELEAEKRSTDDEKRNAFNKEKTLLKRIGDLEAAKDKDARVLEGLETRLENISVGTLEQHVRRLEKAMRDEIASTAGLEKRIEALEAANGELRKTNLILREKLALRVDVPSSRGSGGQQREPVLGVFIQNRDKGTDQGDEIHGADPQPPRLYEAASTIPLGIIDRSPARPSARGNPTVPPAKKGVKQHRQPDLAPDKLGERRINRQLPQAQPLEDIAPGDILAAPASSRKQRSVVEKRKADNVTGDPSATPAPKKARGPPQRSWRQADNAEKYQPVDTRFTLPRDAQGSIFLPASGSLAGGSLFNAPTQVESQLRRSARVALKGVESQADNLLRAAESRRPSTSHVALARNSPRKQAQNPARSYARTKGTAQATSAKRSEELQGLRTPALKAGFKVMSDSMVRPSTARPSANKASSTRPSTARPATKTGKETLTKGATRAIFPNLDPVRRPLEQAKPTANAATKGAVSTLADTPGFRTAADAEVTLKMPQKRPVEQERTDGHGIGTTGAADQNEPPVRTRKRRTIPQPSPGLDEL